METQKVKKKIALSEGGKISIALKKRKNLSPEQKAVLETRLKELNYNPTNKKGDGFVDKFLKKMGL